MLNMASAEDYLVISSVKYGLSNNQHIQIGTLTLRHIWFIVLGMVDDILIHFLTSKEDCFWSTLILIFIYEMNHIFTVVIKLPWYAILYPLAVKWTLWLRHSRSVTYKYQHDWIMICLSTGRFLCWTISVCSSFIIFHKNIDDIFSKCWFYFCCCSQFHCPHSSTMDPSQGSRQVQT